MDRRLDYLIEEGLARRQGQSVIFSHDLLDTLRRAIWMTRLPNSQPKPALHTIPPLTADTLSAPIGSKSRWHPAVSP
jgi:hypothetical protein